MVYETIVGLSKDKQEVKDQIVGRDSSQLVFVNAAPFVEEQEVHSTIRIKKRTNPSSGDAAFILGHTTYGKLGGSLNPQPELGDGNFGAWSYQRIVSDSNTFVEQFSDTEFEDSANTSANWNTTTPQVEF
jgi:hypothetical protein